MLYLECSSGISGDMAAAALIDLGVDKDRLTAVLNTLGVDGWSIDFGRCKKNQIDAGSFNVILENEEVSEYVPEDMTGHGHEHCGEGGHAHGDEHMSADHEHMHEHMHAHVHRNLKDIQEIIVRSEMSPAAKQTALRIFGIIAEAESKVHAMPTDQVHFHEVGAVDSIIDICAVAICLDELGITQVCISPLREGSGLMRCQHGLLAVPVPATAEIVRAHGLIMEMTGEKGEMITPTGAAIAAGIRTCEVPKRFRIVKSGAGAGKRELERANILRAYIIEEEKPRDDQLWTLESNIDDSTGEALGYLMDTLMAAGARDVCYVPVFMKKNRPAYLIKVICREDVRPALEELIFRHSSTIGIRRYMIERTELERSSVTVNTRYGPARVKCVQRDGAADLRPEYDSVAEIADRTGLAFEAVYEEIKKAAVTDE